ncbi:MAG TPA: ornithine cyclodeaminase family protein [Candidatus Binatia bacterium]
MRFINNKEVEQVLTMADTLRVIEEGHRELGRGELVGRPRIDIVTETKSKDRFHQWGTMEGSSKSLKRIAIRMKSDMVSWPLRHGSRVEEKFCFQPGLFCGLVFLFSTENGEPLAVINDGMLQHFRVGAYFGLGAKYLAREDAAVVGMIGSGGMARSHLRAFAAVRPIKKVKVYSPNREHRESYAREMERELHLEAVPCASPEEAARRVDILSSCTDSQEPTISARMLEPGMHLSQVASEFAADVYPKIDVCMVGGPMSQVVMGVGVDDSQGFTTYLAGNVDTYRNAKGPKVSRTAMTRALDGKLVSLVDLVTGKEQGRESGQEISSSSGAKVKGEDTVKGLQFVTVSSLVYDLAVKAGLGREVPREWFLQDIRD